MIKLIDILNKKEEIIAKAKKFGFINLRIYKESYLDNSLHLVVDLDPTNSNANNL